MFALATLFLFTVAAGDPAKPQAKQAEPARTQVTAELACLHCTFGQGEDCVPCLKLDDKTVIILTGKAAKQLETVTLAKTVVVTGALTLDAKKRLSLAGDEGKVFTDADKKTAPAPGQLRVTGKPCCGSCDLKVCDECTLAVVNGAFPIILSGKLAKDHADEAKAITVTGRPFVDARGLVRLEAAAVDLIKK